MQEPRTWRAFLSQLISNPADKRSISEKSGIPQRTLERWASGDTKEPQDYLLRRLIEALPQHRDQLVSLLQKEFAGFETPLLSIDETLKQLPVEFYVRVLEAHALTASPLHFWTLAGLILQQASGQLDVDKTGLNLTIAVCVLPRQDGIVRSLREVASYSTPPWRVGIQQAGYFLGAESLGGYVAARVRAEVAQDINEELLFPLRREDYEAEVYKESGAAYPLQRAGRVAGTLISASTQKQFFTPAKLRLLQHYTNLLVLAFEDRQFYDKEQIRLAVMPRFETQRPALNTYALRMVRFQQQGMSQAEAEARVQQDFEALFIEQAQEEGENSSNAHPPGQPE